MKPFFKLVIHALPLCGLLAADSALATNINTVTSKITKPSEMGAALKRLIPLGTVEEVAIKVMEGEGFSAQRSLYNPITAVSLAPEHPPGLIQGMM